MIAEAEMEEEQEEKKIVQFDIYCDCCGELIPIGAVCYETEEGRLCAVCKEVYSGNQDNA